VPNFKETRSKFRGLRLLGRRGQQGLLPQGQALILRGRRCSSARASDRRLHEKLWFSKAPSRQFLSEVSDAENLIGENQRAVGDRNDRGRLLAPDLVVIRLPGTNRVPLCATRAFPPTLTRGLAYFRRIVLCGASTLDSFAIESEQSLHRWQTVATKHSDRVRLK
jgi:hypothetical protein